MLNGLQNKVAGQICYCLATQYCEGQADRKHICIQTRAHPKDNSKKNSMLLCCCSSKQFYRVKWINQAQSALKHSKGLSHYYSLKPGSNTNTFQGHKQESPSHNSGKHIFQTQLSALSRLDIQGRHQHHGTSLTEAVPSKSSRIRPCQHGQERPHRCAEVT